MKIHFPSVQYLADSAWLAVRRFPLVVASAMLVFSSAVILIERDYQVDQSYQVLINLVLTGAVGVPLFFALAVYAETHAWKPIKWTSNVAGVCLLVMIYFSLAATNTTLATYWPYVRYILFSIVIHLAIAFAPFVQSGNNASFWQFNKMLFIRLWVSLLYAGVLCLGIILAVVAVHLLFDVKIDSNLYSEIFVFHLSVVNIWIFMGGVDHHILQTENSDFPKGLRIFAQYILLSLLVLYLAILYVYVIKTVVIWDWPKGIMAYLTLGVAALGYLTTLLLYPYAQLAEYGWIRKFSRVFYMLMLPLSAVLFIAIGMRLHDYGFTINRYFILVLGIWLALLSMYKLLRPDRIKVIPVSLAVVVLLSSFGFWGAHAVSRRSQVNRLEQLLTDAHLLQNNKLVTEKAYLSDRYLRHAPEGITLPDSISQEISSIIRYLDDYYRFDDIQPWFTQSMDSLVYQGEADSADVSFNINYFDEAQAVLEVMDLNQIATASSYLYAAQSDTYIERVAGYDYLVPHLHRGNYENPQDTMKFRLKGDLYSLAVDTKTQTLTLSKNQQIVIQTPMRNFFLNWEKNQRDNYASIPEVMTDSVASPYTIFELQQHGYKLKINFQYAEISHAGGNVTLSGYEGKLYLGLPKNP